jgi:hypothetical protein
MLPRLAENKQEIPAKILETAGHALMLLPVSKSLPEMPGSNMLAAAHLGATEVFEAEIVAGGETQQPGDYAYMNHRLMYAEGGQWGLIRVLKPGDARIAALPQGSVSPVQVGRPAPIPVGSQVSSITNP